MEETPRRWFGDESQEVRMVHLNRGHLLFKALNFKPDFDVSFGEYNWAAGWTNRWCGMQQECVEAGSLERVAGISDMQPDFDIDPEDLIEFTKTDYKYLRNYFYAVRGLDFKDADLHKFYSQFFWYKPDTENSPSIN